MGPKMKTQPYSGHEHEHNRYIESLRKGLLKCKVVRDYFNQSDEKKKQLTFEQYIEEQFLDIHKQVKK